MLRLLRNLKLLSAIGFALVIATIWLFGYVFGLNTLEQRLIAIVAVMIFWVVALLVGRVFTLRAGAVVERMFRAQLDQAVMQATPEQRGEIALLRKQLLEAISTLKKSNLGHTRGKAALYELPWYMIIGHPAAGKSSAIQNSGLTFPLDQGSRAIRGVGGTRNCDWFFTTEGVLLDTAGRYSVQPEDRTEWLEFLHLLKANRPRTPINGILVAISFPELAQYKSEGFAEYARQIRARINEIDRAFSRKVPVYLFFTKIDLLGGFAQFFEDMTEKQRSQVWGATLSHEQAEKTADVAAMVSAEFEKLFRGLADMGNEKLAISRGDISRPALFAFPIEFNSMRSAVSRFVEILFEDDPYHTHPLLRGFYFTSALQEGSPKIPAGARVSSKFALAGAEFSTTKAPKSESYFLRDLFRDVIFPDQHLVSRQIKTAHSHTRWVGLLAGVFVFSIVVGAWGWSFYHNQQLINEITNELTLADSADMKARLNRLNTIQTRLKALEQGRPGAMGFGLYQGEELVSRLQNIYVAEISQLLLAPVKKDIETRLLTVAGSSTQTSNNAVVDAPNLSTEQYYEDLKTYLMMHRKERLEASYLSEHLMQHWKNWLDENRGSSSQENIHQVAKAIVEYYVLRFPLSSTPVIENQEAIVVGTRQYLNGVIQKISPKDRIYSELISQATNKYPRLTVARVLENAGVDLISGSYSVSPAYTRAAWEGYMRQAVDDASRGTFKDDDWVLENSGGVPQLNAENFENNRRELLAMYKAAYTSEWRKFIAGLSINGFRNINESINGIDRLSDFNQSPLRRVFARVAYETEWDNPQFLKESPLKEEKNIKEAIVDRLLSESDSRAKRQTNVDAGEVEEKFALFARMTSEKEGSPTLVPYFGALGKVKSRLESIQSSGDAGKSARQLMKSTADAGDSELITGMQIVDGQLLAGADAEMRDVLKPILLRPFTSSYGVLIPLANSDINQNWQHLVLPYWTTIAGKYPFVDSSNEAPITDIAKFLEPEAGTLNKFINEDLSGLLVRKGNVYTSRRWFNMSVPFTREFLANISRASDIQEKIFFAGGQSQFELQPVPIPGLSEVVLEIDGQQLRYRNGPQLWTTFSWPIMQSAQGAKLSVVTFAGVSATVAAHPGRMGWTRLVSAAKVTSNSQGATQLTWMVDSPDSKGSEKIAIKFNLRQVSGANLLAMSSLRDLNLPKKIVN